MSEKITVQNVLDQLIDEGLVLEENLPLMEETLISTETKNTPWYLRVSIGISAWIASLLLVIGVGMMFGFEEGLFLIFGFFAMLGAVVMRTADDQSDFTTQFSLAGSMFGQILFLFGFEELFGVGDVIVLFTAILLNIILIIYFKDKLHRFLSTLVIIAGLDGIFYDLNVEPLILIFAAVLALLATLLMENENRLFPINSISDYVGPVGYGIVVGLLLKTAYLVGQNLVDLAPRSWLILPIGLFLVLVYLEVRIMNERGIAPISKTGGVVFGATLLLGVIAIQSPGMMAAIVVLLLGFKRGNRLVYWTAVAFIGYFIIEYYYNLDLTLLVKSWVLMGSGAVLLGLRWMLKEQDVDETVEVAA